MLTFINKLDQPARDPFELLDQIERVLGISAAPMNWPLGDGPDFRGVYDLEASAILFYERQEQRGRRTAPVMVSPRRTIRRSRSWSARSGSRS